jgi:hypothetical protein
MLLALDHIAQIQREIRNHGDMPVYLVDAETGARVEVTIQTALAKEGLYLALIPQRPVSVEAQEE